LPSHLMRVHEAFLGACDFTAPASATGLRAPRWGRAGSAFTVCAVCVGALLPGNLGPVPDQEAGVAGELVLGLRDDLDDQLLGDELAAGDTMPVQAVGFIEFQDDAAGVRCVRRLQCLQGVLLGFLDVGTDFVVIGCHVAGSLFWNVD
jgi:hypothetical protein